MSKKAVILSWGYPPELATPSTSLNAWKYWLKRFTSKIVRFDSDGKTTEAIDIF